MTRTAMLVALLLAAPATAQKSRFELDFGLVDIERTGQQEFRLPSLPEADIAFGLRLTAAAGPCHLPKATVRIALFTNSGSRRDISAIVRRHSRAGERENGQIVRRRAARGG